MSAVLLDANLLILLIVGTADRTYISKHRRLRAYPEDDFNLLLRLIAPMSPIIVTPNILTEASNLASQIGEPARMHIAMTFRAVLGDLEERYVDSRRAAEQPEFPRLWLTDAGILDEMTDTDVLLTADLDLHLAALGSVEIWDFPKQDIVIQAWDGPICADRCPVGENGTALPREEVGPRSQRFG